MQPDKRRQRIAKAVPQAAVWLARADTCRDDDVRSMFTELAYKHLAGHGLDFRPDVLAAIDAHLVEQRQRAAQLAVMPARGRVRLRRRRMGVSHSEGSTKRDGIAIPGWRLDKNSKLVKDLRRLGPAAGRIDQSSAPQTGAYPELDLCRNGPSP